MDRITNITTGICHSRLQLGEPSFVVTWKRDNKQHYKFFSIVYAMYKFKEHLEKYGNDNVMYQVLITGQFQENSSQNV